MAGRGRGGKAAAPPAARSDKNAAAKAPSARTSDRGAARAAPQSPPQKGKKTGGATDDARQDARAEAQLLAENDEENSKTPPPASPPPVPNKADRAVTVELNKEKAERARLQAETERLKQQLDDLVKEKKRKQSDAAEPAPPAKRSGRRTAPQSAGISRRRLSVCTSISVIDFFVT